MAKKKHFSKSYKEQTNPYPSGEWKGRTMWVVPHPLPPINENWEFEYPEYNGKEEISSVFWESAYDAEQEIYDNIDYKLWSTDINADLLEVLQYNEQHEEVDETEHLEKTKKNKYSFEMKEEEHNNHYSQKNFKKDIKDNEKLFNEHHEILQDELSVVKKIDERHPGKDNTNENIKARNSKNKRHYRRRQHTKSEPAHRIKKWVKKKKTWNNRQAA